MADKKEDTKKLETKPTTDAKAAAKPAAPKPVAKPAKSEPAASKSAAPKAAAKTEKKDEKKEEKKYIRESVHTIPLRDAFFRKRTDRANRAIREINRYVQKHTRKDAIIDPAVNELIWAQGMQSAPRRIKVKLLEDEKTTLVKMA